MIKIITKSTVAINLVGILFILLGVTTIYPNSAEFYGDDFTFSILFLSIIYITALVHSFSNDSLKSKAIILFCDLIPILLFIIVTSFIDSNTVRLFVLDSISLSLVFYFGAGSVLLIISEISHTIYTEGKNEKNKK